MTSERAVDGWEDGGMNGTVCVSRALFYSLMSYAMAGPSNRAARADRDRVLDEALAATRGEPPEPGPAIDVERLARALNESVGTLGWLHLTPPNAVDEWRENARIIAIEYDRLRP